MRFFGFSTYGERFRTILTLGAAALLLARITENISLSPQDQAYCNDSISTRGCALLLKIVSEIRPEIELKLGAVAGFFGLNHLINRNHPQVADIEEAPPQMQAARR